MVGFLLGIWIMIFKGLAERFSLSFDMFICFADRPIEYLVFFTFPILAIGGLLIYTLRDKTK